MERLHDLEQADRGAGGELGARGDERRLVGRRAGRRSGRWSARGTPGRRRSTRPRRRRGSRGTGGALQRRIERDEQIAVADRVRVAAGSGKAMPAASPALRGTTSAAARPRTSSSPIAAPGRPARRWRSRARSCRGAGARSSIVARSPCGGATSTSISGACSRPARLIAGLRRGRAGRASTRSAGS